MTPGELALLLSQLQGRPLPTVNLYAKKLREAQLLSTKGRGPSAAHMTRDDAINLLIALCGCYTANSAPEMIGVWRAMPLLEQPTKSAPLTFLAASRFDDFLHGLMDSMASGDLERWTKNHLVAFALDFEVAKYTATFTLDRYLRSGPRVDPVVLKFSNTKFRERSPDPDEPPLSDRIDIVRVGRKTIEALAQATAADGE